MSVTGKVRTALLGAPKSVKDPHAFHKASLVALLAWVGLGADGLSSSAYGPDEAYRALGEHTGLAVFLALATALTVLIISYGYSQIIEQFPAGGGGYVVASKLLGPRAGVISGSALLVDYVLTIAISIAAGADAVYSFLPVEWQNTKLFFAFAGLLVLVIMNLRGVRESVLAIAPLFAVFIVTHAFMLIFTGIKHGSDLPAVSHEVRQSISGTVTALGMFGTLHLFVRAYALGGGTYTGIEAVSNGLSMMREPRVVTARRTMVLMAVSLAVTAGGILLSYLLIHARPVPGKTMNAVLVEDVARNWVIGGWNVGMVFIVITLLSEGTLLFVAAQAGFLDGPRVMATMATDSWLPHRFSALSERLTMRNGVILMAVAASGALLYAQGAVSKLVVMYSINVFLTFSLSNIAMIVYWYNHRKTDKDWAKHLPAHVLASLLCLTILGITIVEKFAEGGWLTMLVTVALALLCYMIKGHYKAVVQAIRQIDLENRDAGELSNLNPRVSTIAGEPLASTPQEQELLSMPPDPNEPVAILFVGGYGGLGRRALIGLQKMFPGHFKGVVFASVALVDSDTFKGARELEALEKRTEQHLQSYRRFAARLGLRSAGAHSVGTEVAVEGAKLGIEQMEKYPKGLVVAGQLIFDEDTAWNRFLHNETAFLIQRRLQHAAVPMIVLPVQLQLNKPKTKPEAQAA